MEKLCLCITDELEYKGYISGNEYYYRKSKANNEMYCVDNENCEIKWFFGNEMSKYFKRY